MSYYENRIKALEERVAQLAREQRMKAIPVEAKLVERIALLQAENKRLTKAGDKMVKLLKDEDYNTEPDEYCMKEVVAWNAAKEGKPSV